MPDPQRKLPRGPGTFDPEFTSQVTPVQTGPVAVVQETQFERLERAMETIGAGIATSFQSLAQQQASLGRLKDQAIARQERVMSSIISGQFAKRESLQRRRLQDVQNRQQELLARADQHDPEWLFRQSRIGFNNSASSEEQAMWSELLIGSRELANQFKVSEEKDEQNDIVQQYAMAGQTATVAVSEMVSNLQADPDLQRELMGNGVGIHQRVQDWILSEATDTAPDIFDIDRSDPNFELKEEQRNQLIAELVEQSFPVADSLVRQHTGESEATSFQTGADLLSAQLLAYFKGRVGIEAVTDSIVDVGKLHFNHLPDTEQRTKFKQFLADSIESATAGQFGQDIGDIEERVSALVTIGPYNDLEKDAISNLVAERLAGLATQGYASNIQRAKLLRTIETPVLGDNGTIQMLSTPDPNAAVMLSVPGHDGRTEYDRIADQSIIDSGLDINPTDMTPIQLAAASQIRDTAIQLNAEGQRLMVKKISAQDNIRAVRNGDPLADASKAYDNGLITAAFSTGVDLSPLQVRAIVEQNKAVQSRNQALMGVTQEPDPRQVWDGKSPIKRTAETRSLRESVYRLEAENIWNQQATMNTFKLPDNMLANMKQQWTGGSPEAMMDVVFFTSALVENRQDEVFDAMGQASVEAVALRGAIHNYKKAANDIEFRMPVQDLMDTARQRMNTQSPSDFLEQTTPFIDYIGVRNNEVASAVFADLLATQGLDTRTESTFFGLGSNEISEEHKERVTAIQSAMMSSGKESMDRLFNLWATRVQRTNETPEEAAQWAYGQMRDQGFRIINLDGEAALVEDVMGHFGPDSPDVVSRRRREIVVGAATSNQRAERVPIGTFNERMEAYSQAPLLPWQRTVIQQALGLLPKDAPRTIGDIYTKVPHIINPSFLQDSRGNLAEGIKFVVSDGQNRDGQFILRKSASDFGGVIIQPIAFDGRMLPVARALHDVEWTDPDGVTHFLRKGEPLSVFSDHLFNQVVEDLNPPRSSSGDLSPMIFSP